MVLSGGRRGRSKERQAYSTKLNNKIKHIIFYPDFFKCLFVAGFKLMDVNDGTQ